MTTSSDSLMERSSAAFPIRSNPSNVSRSTPSALKVFSLYSGSKEIGLPLSDISEILSLFRKRVHEKSDILLRFRSSE